MARPDLVAFLKWAGHLPRAGGLRRAGLRARTPARHVRAPDASATAWGRSCGRRFRGPFLAGFAVSASNPKAVLFFAALFPQFLDPSRPRTTQLALLGLTFAVLDVASLTADAWLPIRLRSRFIDGLSTLADRAAGRLLLLAALLLALAHV